MTLQFGQDRYCTTHRTLNCPCLPRARSTDPSTSHEAAESITAEKVRESQRLILSVLRDHGPLTDEGIWWFVNKVALTTSPSGARTRRSELVRQGLVEDSGRTETLSSGRRAIVWRAVQ